jgi:fumarate reductase flavoprotein subunit
MKNQFYVLVCAALVILAGCDSSAPEGPKNLSTDVVVVGSGLSGFSAAIKAREAGVNVILLEKLDITGGSSARSGGGIGAANSSVQQAFDITDTAASWKGLWQERQAMSPNGKTTYPDWAAVDWLLAQGPNLIGWMKEKLEFSGKTYGRPEGYGFDPVERIHFPPATPDGTTGGAALIWYVQQYAESKGVQILLKHEAKELVRSGGAVTGVKVETPDGEITVSAKAVVLAAGGFPGKETLKQYIPSLPDVESVAAPGDTGDGIRMAVEAGAVLYDDPWIIGLYTAVAPGNPMNYLFMNPSSYHVYVNAAGSRVMNEAQHYALITNATIAAGGILYGVYDSSPANQTATALIGANLGEYAFKGDTLTALAQSAGIAAAAFETTITTYNSYASSGNDAAFSKDSDFLKALSTPPYYAVKVKPNIMGTIGGVKTKYQTGEVLDAQGAVIPGLYAAGENANHIFLNQVYMTGGALAIASTTGRAAGENAAAYAAAK